MVEPLSFSNEPAHAGMSDGSEGASGGRSSSPSHGQPSPAESPQSRESEASEASGAAATAATLTAGEPGYAAMRRTAAASDSRGPGASGGRESEPEQARGARRKFATVRVTLPEASAAAVEFEAATSGLIKGHFLATALLIGVQALSAQLRGGGGVES